MSNRTLSPQLIEVVRWLSQGKTVIEIADILGVSRRTIERRLDRAYDVTGTCNCHGLVGMAFRKGWIT